MKRIPEIDGLRALAIIMVIAYHYFNNLLSVNSTSLYYLKLLTNQMWSGVDLFFIISGFLISTLLFKSRGRASYFKDFYIKRFFRIFPIYYGVLILYVFIRYFSCHVILEGDEIPMWSYFVYLQNFFFAKYNNLGVSILSVSWSLAVEEQFYLVWPIMIYIFNRKNFLVFLCILLALCLLVRFSVSNDYTRIFVLPSRMDGLILGSLIGYLYVFYNDVLKKISISLIIIIGSLVCFFYYIMIFLIDSNFMGVNVFPIVIFYSVLLLLVLNSRELFIKRLLRNKLLYHISSISYGVYLYHMIIISLFFYIFKGSNPSLTTYLDLILITISLIVTYLVSYVSFHKIERPLIFLGRKMLGNHT